jgi:hypothetical protein
MKRRTFMLRPLEQHVDYRDDQVLLAALEQEVKLASRFFTIVDFLTENPDSDSESAKELMANLGQIHWQKAKEIIQRRRDLINQYGPHPSFDDPSSLTVLNDPEDSERPPKKTR